MFPGKHYFWRGKRGWEGFEEKNCTLKAYFLHDNLLLFTDPLPLANQSDLAT